MKVKKGTNIQNTYYYLIVTQEGQSIPCMKFGSQYDNY